MAGLVIFVVVAASLSLFLSGTRLGHIVGGRTRRTRPEVSSLQASTQTESSELIPPAPVGTPPEVWGGSREGGCGPDEIPEMGPSDSVTEMVTSGTAGDPELVHLHCGMYSKWEEDQFLDSLDQTWATKNLANILDATVRGAAGRILPFGTSKYYVRVQSLNPFVGAVIVQMGTDLGIKVTTQPPPSATYQLASSPTPGQASSSIF
jgi:hypothetical protein